MNETLPLDPRLRRLIAWSLLGATVLTLIGFALTPWEDEQTVASYHDALAGSPGRAQAAAATLHFGYLLFAPAAAGIAALLWRSGGKLLWTGIVLCVLGLTTLPGLLVTDAYDLVLAQELPRAESAPLSEKVDDLWLPIVLTGPTILGAILGPIVLLFALARRGGVSRWAPWALLAGWIVPWVGFSAGLFVAGGVIMVGAAVLVARTLTGEPVHAPGRWMDDGRDVMPA